MRSTPHASPALGGRGDVLSKAVRAVPSNRLLSQSLDSLLFGLNLFQLRFVCGFAMTSQGYVGSRLRATPLLNFLPPESPIIDTRPAKERFRNLKIALLYFQPNFRRESAGRKPTQHPDMKYIGLPFVLGVLLPMIFGLFRFLLGNPAKKASPLVEYVQKKGYRLVNPSISQALGSSGLELLKNPTLRNLTDASSDIADIDELDRPSGGSLAFTCNVRSKEITVFNCSTAGARNGHGGPIPYKVAKVKAAGLPRFSLGKNSVVHSVLDVVDKMVGESKPGIHVDRSQYPDFSAHYWVRGADAAAVSAFLTPAKISFFETAKLPGTLASNANYLLYFEDGTLRTEPDFDSFIATVEKLIAAIL